MGDQCFFSHILLINLVRDSMGPATTSFLILSRSVPSSLFHSPPPSSVRAHATLLPAFLSKKVEPPIQNSAVNNPPLPQILALPLQQDVPNLPPPAVCDAPPPPLYVSIQGI